MLFNPLKKEILHATWRKTLTTLAVMMIALPAHAACSNNEDGNPGQNGEIEYFTANDTLYYCDDTNWIPMVDINSPLPPNLIAHWKLDETSGTTAFDNSITGADATMNGTLTGADSVTGVAGNALLLDATANTITSNDSAYDQMTYYTVCTWFYDEGNGGSYLNLVGKDSGSRTDGWNLYFEASTRALGFYNTDGRYEETSGGAYNYDEWNHVCGSTDGGTSGDSIQLYLNGTLLTQAETCLSACPDQDDSANDVTIGHKSNINIFYDDVRIYDRILIAPEIIDLFNLGKETPIGHWKLDETSGTAILDSSLNSDNGAMFGGLSGAENVNGKIETALTLDGVDDYILINDSSTLDFASGFDLTSSIWVKIPADSNCSGNKVALSYRAAFGRQWWLGCWTTNVAHFEVEASENTEINGTTPLNDGKWHLITGTYNGTTNVTSLYVDGILEATETVNLTDNLIGTSPLCIGEYGLTCTGDYHFKGALDDARIYNKELSANEVYILAHCTRPGNQFYNYNEDVHQWCDTVNSPINTTTPSSGSGGCSPEGAFRYNIDRYQSCDGAGWVDIGK